MYDSVHKRSWREVNEMHKLPRVGYKHITLHSRGKYYIHSVLLNLQVRDTGDVGQRET